jgi:predicted nuclease with TOPRIM domain
MSVVTENDIKELKTFISEHFSELEKGQTDIRGQLTEIRGQLAVVDSRLKNLETSSQKIPDLAEKVGELKNWKQIALTLGGALLGVIITYLAKSPKF